MKIVTSMYTLIRLAKAVGQAEQKYNRTGTEEDRKTFEEAKAKHDDYLEICKIADEMSFAVPEKK